MSDHKINLEHFKLSKDYVSDLPDRRFKAIKYLAKKRPKDFELSITKYYVNKPNKRLFVRYIIENKLHQEDIDIRLKNFKWQNNKETK